MSKSVEKDRAATQTVTHLKSRIAELERRVRDLEARPVYVPLPYYPVQPPNYTQPWRAPWESPWYVTTSGGATITVRTTDGLTGTSATWVPK